MKTEPHERARKKMKPLRLPQEVHTLPSAARPTLLHGPEALRPHLTMGLPYSGIAIQLVFPSVSYFLRTYDIPDDVYSQSSADPIGDAQLV